MGKKKFEIIALFAVLAMIFSQIPLLIMLGGTSIPIRKNSDISEDAIDIKEPEVDNLQVGEIDTASKEVGFTYSQSHDINLPFNIDIWSQYLHANTQIDVDWKLYLPIDIDVTYNNTFYMGDTHNIDIQMSIPSKAAYFQINTTTNFDMSWHLFGVEDGSVSTKDYKWNFQYNFDTPIGRYNLDFLKYRYNIPVTVYGVTIGNLYVEVTPQIISSIMAKILSDPNFYDTLAMEWASAGTKTIALTARTDASDTGQWVTVNIGDFEYTISIGLEWAVGFEFVGAFKIINYLLDYFGYDLHWVLGTWPIIKIGSLSSPDQVDLNTWIINENETGLNYDHAIGIDPFEWWDNPQEISFPNPAGSPPFFSWYFRFPVFKDWEYKFAVSSCSGGINVYPYFYDDDKSTILASNTNLGYPKQISRTASEDTYWYLVLTPEDGTTCKAMVNFTDIRWPGIDKDNPRSLVHPYGGDYWFVTQKNSTSYYSFVGSIGQTLSFWCYEYNADDNLDLELTYLGATVASSSNLTGNMENLTHSITVPGQYILNVKGITLQNDRGYYWLDFGLASDAGNSINDPDSFTGDTYVNDALGAEISTKGGNWIQLSTTSETINDLIFDGDNWGRYDIQLVDSDKSTIIQKCTFNGTAITLTYVCNTSSSGTKYLHILPYMGGFSYNISKSSSPLYYSGEDRDHALLTEINFPLVSHLPTDWGNNTFWSKIYVNKGEMLLLKLEHSADDNFDLYLYLNTLVLDSEQHRDDTEVIVYDTSHTTWYAIQVDQVQGDGQYTLTAAIAKECEQGDYDGEFTAENLNQYYYLELKEGDTIDINLDCDGFRSSYVDLYLYDSELNELEKDEGPELKITYTAKESGTYFIRIHNSEIGAGAITGVISVTEEESISEGLDPLFLILLIIGVFAAISIVSIAVLGIHRVRHGEWSWQTDKFKSKMQKLRSKLSSSRENLSAKVSVSMSHIKSKRTAQNNSNLDVDRIIEMKGEESKSMAEEANIEFEADDINTEELSSFMKKFKVSENKDNAEFWKDLIDDKGLTEDDINSLKDSKISDHLRESDFWKKFVKDKKDQ